jgi:hypothetical protein
MQFDAEPARIAVRKIYEFPLPEVSLAYYESIARRAQQRAAMTAWLSRAKTRLAEAKRKAALLAADKVPDSPLKFFNEYGQFIYFFLCSSVAFYVHQGSMVWVRRERRT